ncbi:pentatricopeptide repeat-containing protein At2g13600 [Dendrobium catenatum]|uniref:Pentatricopeptide repeat-containing protein n=1 Tax=Dendrobium catenatum TaxID=906689 RepID=A0A2I0WEU3_9ASPA|nr:pentatricopeptide repeat-containing protein At2g13600 [Dendrobium catenatum]PKU74152.1 Pentatricopeptide repeat-containing protein [Dendrobium catenatum]
MRATFSRQFCSPSLYTGRLNLSLFSLTHLIPLCCIPTRADQSSPATNVSKKPTRPFYLLHLKASASSSIVHSVQSHAFKTGFLHDLIICTSVLKSLAEFGEVNRARKLFDEMLIRDVAAWNAMISGYVRNGLLLKARLLYQLMYSSCTRPNSVTLSVLLQLCGDLDDQMLGRSIHGYAYRHLELEDTFLGNSLIVYYNKFDDIKASERVFESLARPDIVSWNAMVSGYMTSSSPWSSLELLWILRNKCFHLDLITLEIALQACSRIGKDAIFDGVLIHGLLIRLGFKMDLYAQNCLLIMYCKCGMVASGQSLFDTMESKNFVSWNMIVSGYIHINCPFKALDLFLRALAYEAEISSDLLVSALQAVRLMGEQRKLVMFLHGLVIRMGFDSDIYISSSFISAYGGTVEVECARKFFNCILPAGNHSTVLFNSMISVYLHHGYFSEAVELTRKEFFYDAVSIVNILSLCIAKLGLKVGKAVHGYTIRNKFESDLFISTSLLELYITYGVLHTAFKIFLLMPDRNLVSWNTMIIGCARLGVPWASLKLFYDMLQKDGFLPDATSLVGAIEAISHRGIENERKFIHDYVIKSEFINDEFVSTSLICMHSRAHNFSKVKMVFDRARKLGIVTWNTMIAEYSHHGLMDRAISTFGRMKINGVTPDSVTMLCLLQGCIASASLNGLALVHSIICKSGYHEDVYVGSALINAYSKCGELNMAWLVFDNMVLRTIVSWNSMMLGYGIHGDVQEASKLFLKMQESGLHPSAVTFLVLISACSHAGYVERGIYYLDLMTEAYSLHPREEHISSFISLLGRGGLVKEANELLDRIPEDHGVFAWGAFIGACRVQGNMELGLSAAQKLLVMKPLNPGYNALLSNILAESGRWIEASLTRSKADEVGFRKEKAWSMVQTLV